MHILAQADTKSKPITPDFVAPGFGHEDGCHADDIRPAIADWLVENGATWTDYDDPEDRRVAGGFYRGPLSVVIEVNSTDTLDSMRLTPSVYENLIEIDGREVEVFYTLIRSDARTFVKVEVVE